MHTTQVMICLGTWGVHHNGYFVKKVFFSVLAYFKKIACRGTFTEEQIDFSWFFYLSKTQKKTKVNHLSALNKNIWNSLNNLMKINWHKKIMKNKSSTRTNVYKQFLPDKMTQVFGQLNPSSIPPSFLVDLRSLTASWWLVSRRSWQKKIMYKINWLNAFV